MLEYYEAIETSQNIDIPELDIGRPPDFLMGVLSKFFELHKGRRYTESGPCPISFGDIMTWQELTGWGASLFEVNLIRDLDSLYLSVTAEAQRNKAPR